MPRFVAQIRGNRRDNCDGPIASSKDSASMAGIRVDYRRTRRAALVRAAVRRRRARCNDLFPEPRVARAPPGATYRDVFATLAARIAAYFPAQAPQLEGPDADKQLFLDSSGVPAALPGSRTRGRSSILRGAPRSALGRFQIRRVSSWTSKTSPRPMRSQMLRSNRVDVFNSWARVISGSVREASSGALEMSTTVRDEKVRVIADIPQ